MNQYQRLGDWLVTNSIISDHQRTEALAAQEVSRGRLGEILVAMGACLESDVVRCLAQQYSYPVAKLTQLKPSRAALSMISPTIALRKRLLPVKVSDTEFHCVICDPLDLDSTDSLAKALNRRVVMSIAGSEELFEFISHWYALPLPKKSFAPQQPMVITPSKTKLKIQSQPDRAELISRIAMASTFSSSVSLTEGRS